MSTIGKLVIGLIIAGVVVLILTALPAKGPGVPEADTSPIKLGFIGPLTGDTSAIGQNAKAAVEIAVEEVNSGGGVGGRMIEVIYEDGQCDGAAASNAANKLINIDKVVMILGGACSGETSAFTGLAEQTQTPVLSYCSSAPAISQAGDFIFRNYPSDTFQGLFAADYVFNTLSKKDVAILYVKSDWGSGIKDVFVNKFKELGGTIAGEEGYEPNARDLRPNLTKIKSAKPDLLYFLGDTEASIPGLKQAAELKLAVPILGSDVWDDAKIWTEVGAAGDGVMYLVASTRGGDEFKTKMQAKVGTEEIAVCSPTAYDGLKIIAQVLGQTGTADRVAIKDALYQTAYTGGVSFDNIRFGSNGDLVSANYVVKEVIDGVATPVVPPEPEPEPNAE